MASVTRTRSKAPDVTVSETAGAFRAVVAISDAAPTRVVSSVEAARGIDSLDPVTVRARSPRALVDLACHATLSAVWATTPNLSPGECCTIWIRTAAEVRRALNTLGFAT